MEVVKPAYRFVSRFRSSEPGDIEVQKPHDPMTERMTEEPYDPMTERMTEAQLLPVSEQPHAVGTVVTIKPVTILEKDVAAINVRVRAETQGDPTWRDHLFYNWFSNLWPACLCSSTRSVRKIGTLSIRCRLWLLV